jgi:hypothetical protein
MLLNMKSDLTPQDRKVLRTEIETVLAVAGHLERAHDHDDRGQRVILTLPRHYLHMAKFLAAMDSDAVPASLQFWRYACEDGANEDALQRKIGCKLRSYLEEELMIRISVAMMRLKADADHPRGDNDDGEER